MMMGIITKIKSKPYQMNLLSLFNQEMKEYMEPPKQMKSNQTRDYFLFYTFTLFVFFLLYKY